MRVLYTSDLHGRLALYDQLTHLVRAEQPDLVILGGDNHADADPQDPLSTQVAFVEKTVLPLITAWRRRLPTLEVLCVLGNHDLVCTQEALEAYHEAGQIVLLDHHRVWEKNGVAFVGLPHTPPSPYWAKDYERLDLPGDPLPSIGGQVWDPISGCLRHVEPAEHFGRRPALSQELDCGLNPPEPWIFVCHVPPHGTKLDRVSRSTGPIGSRAVRAFIEHLQPRCALHGHVHESPQVTGDYRQQLGQTWCINPGQEHERLHAVLFDARQPDKTFQHTLFS